MTKKTTSKTAKSTSKKATKAPSKKALKLPKVDPKAVEIGTLCVHALALVTNAVIRKRTENAVEMFIPLTLAIGKKTEALEITYRVALDIMKVDDCERVTLSELGAALFKDLCNIIRDSEKPWILSASRSMPLRSLKSLRATRTSAFTRTAPLRSSRRVSPRPRKSSSI